MDLWEAQNRVWGAAQDLRVASDLSPRVAKALWFDERTLAARAQGPKRPEAVPEAAAAL